MQNNKALAVKIYKDRSISKLSFIEIGVRYNMPTSEALVHYKYGKKLQGEYAWLIGLSYRAQTQIKRTNYKDFATLNHDVSKGIVNLGELLGVGPKVTREIKEWLKFPNDRRKRERRTSNRD